MKSEMEISKEEKHILSPEFSLYVVIVLLKSMRRETEKAWIGCVWLFAITIGVAKFDESSW